MSLVLEFSDYTYYYVVCLCCGTVRMANAIQEVLTRHFQSRLDAEADRLWDEGILNQEKLDEIRKMDLHAK